MGKRRVSLDRGLHLVETKLREADYFLTRMGQAGFDHWGFSCDLSAFLASSRSVTFTMQSVMKGNPRWEAWYATASQGLSGPRARLMRDLRNSSEKNGDLGLTGGSMRSGVVTFHLEPRLTSHLAKEEQMCGALELCRRHMGSLVALVDAWVCEFKGMWGQPGSDDEIDPDFPFGWERHLEPDGSEYTLLGSPGETPPSVDDLVERYPLFPDPS